MCMYACTVCALWRCVLRWAVTLAHLWSFPNKLFPNRHVLLREGGVLVKPVRQRKPGGGRPQQRRAAQTLPGGRTGRVSAQLCPYFEHTGVLLSFSICQRVWERVYLNAHTDGYIYPYCQKRQRIEYWSAV